jgi:predicted lysophospholipase L1 biosynthesis ABC-type transport system permease subunit
VRLFGAEALALAAIGIYGVVAFSVARRTQEFGIRMALGAQRRAFLRLVVGEGARLAMLGVGIGIAASFVIMRLLSSLLFGVSATDPITFAAVAALLSLVALLASYVPARRAMRLDPNTALRCESIRRRSLIYRPAIAPRPVTVAGARRLRVQPSSGRSPGGSEIRDAIKRRNAINPVRIRVFTLPSGWSRRAAISAAE